SVGFMWFSIVSRVDRLNEANASGHASREASVGTPLAAESSGSELSDGGLQDGYISGMKDLLRTTADRAARYLASLKERSVAPTPEALANLARLDEPFPEHPTDAARVIALLDEVGSPATIGSAGGRFFGFVVGGSLPATVAASSLAAAWDQNAGIVVLSPIAARLEHVAMRWLLDVLGLPAACGVGFVTCATLANFSGLAAARHALLARRGWNVEAQGLFGAPPITVVVGEEVHVSVLKALMLV